MRVLLLTLVVSLLAGRGIAEETVILSDGSRMQVQSFEVQGIISSLSRHPDLKVISRNSSFRYLASDVDVATVGRELSVEAVLLGRIVQRGDDLSVSAELVRTRDASQIWGQQFVRKVSDVFALQQELANEITGALRLELAGDLTRQATVSTEAVAAYMKGRYFWNRRSEEGFEQSIVHFREAVEREPGYADGVRRTGRRIRWFRYLQLHAAEGRFPRGPAIRGTSSRDRRERR